MKTVFKRFSIFAASLLLILGFNCCVFAVDSNVSYSGNAGQFIFEPGSEHSLTDLFQNFKDVMPGDKLTQKITVKNYADKSVKADIYLRSLGAKDEESEKLLKEMKLTVQAAGETMMFRTAAEKTEGLGEWIFLGTLESGGQVDLIVTLEVPCTVDNGFQNSAGYLNWQFKVDEKPVENDNSEIRRTGFFAGIIMFFAAIIKAITAFFTKHR